MDPDLGTLRDKGLKYYLGPVVFVLFSKVITCKDAKIYHMPRSIAQL